MNKSDKVLNSAKSFLVKHKLTEKIDLEKIAKMIYGEQDVKVMHRIAGLFLDAVKTETQANDAVQIVQDLWNFLPHNALGDKSPNEVMRAHIKKHPPRKREGKDWTCMDDILMGIPGSFQAKVYEIIDPMPAKLKDQIIIGSHLVWQRWFYAARDGKSNSGSWADVIEQVAEDRGIRLLRNEQLMIRVFQTPAHSTDKHKQIRQVVGVEEPEHMPLVWDLLGDPKSQPIYFADPDYLELLQGLRIKLKAVQITPQVVLRELVPLLIHRWWMASSSIQALFNEDELERLWITAINQAKDKWSSMDDVFEVVMRRYEQGGIDLDFARKQMTNPRGKFDEPKGSRDEVQMVLVYTLGQEICRYILTPLVIYMPILKLHYLESFDLKEELDYYTELKPLPPLVEVMSAPPSFFGFRPLGEFLWDF